jgi:dTDP-glucose pyrophosphorylase/CBS domain-containing protein
MQSAEIIQHTIGKHQSVRDALIKLNDLRADSILFVVDDGNHLLGTLTDGDLRRGFIKGLMFDTPLLDYVQPDPLFIYEDEIHLADMNDLRRRNLLVLPIVNRSIVITRVINLRLAYSVIPADVIIMAGGKGLRLLPLTKDTPKPMLHVGDKPILEHQIDLLAKYSMRNIHITVNYLAHKIEEYFKDGSERGLKINYIREDKPLGTLGAVGLINSLEHDYVLIMNSDILTNIDLEGFFQTFIRAEADMAVASTSYQVEVPYGVLEVDGDNKVSSLREKPRYTYYSNAGIYLVKKELLRMIPNDEVYNVTDLMEALIKQGGKLVSYPILGYWLDIGKHEDFRKAQEDIRYITI